MAKEPTPAYIAPLAVYLVGTSLAASWADYYPAAYAGVVAVTALVTVWALRQITVIRPHRRVGLGVLVGLIGIAVWIGLSRLGLEARLTESFPNWLQPQSRVGFDPFSELSRAEYSWAFVLVRMVGLAVLVPIAEEVFWRGFLLRWIISDRWREVPIGQFELKSFLIVTLLFTLAHPEWFAAAVYAILLNALLYWTKDLWQCIVAHAVSNLTLGLYVLHRGAWELW